MKPFFMSIPHSGEIVPAEVSWLAGLPEPILMCDVDRYVDRLYAPVVDELELDCVSTPWHRYVVDLNRLPEDVDADSVRGSSNPSGKFTSGLHWVKTTRGDGLMPGPISQDLHRELVAKYYEPFHVAVREKYASWRARGARKTFHLDAHSMPSMGTTAHRDPGQRRADIVVSDWEGRSCDGAYRDLVIAAYSSTGLHVGYNWPYVGGRITQLYGQPQLGQQAIQVEINRALYMDEESKRWIPERAQALVAKLAVAVRHIYAAIEDLA